MIFFRYRITLHDPLYYAREGLSAAFTPPVLHATAVNHAVTAALGLHPEGQPFVIAETNGGMDVPRYTNSSATPDFYFTAAALDGPPHDWTEVAKGDSEGFLFQVKPGEILKATQLHFLPPETELVGLGLAQSKMDRLPRRIRLGSFRGVARLEQESTEEFKPLGQPAVVDHPVDPLISEAIRGVMLNVFPYPLVCNALCRKAYQLKFEHPRFGPKTARIAWPAGYPEPTKTEQLHGGGTAII